MAHSKWVLLLSAVLFVSRVFAAPAVSAEAKVYPAPGMPGTTNIEIFAPVAKTLFEGLKKSATETVEEGASVFEIRKNDSYLCTRKLVNGSVTDHFCTLHMQADGTVAPGHAGEFDVDGREPSGARGIGVIAVQGKSLRVTEKAAEALFDNMTVPLSSDKSKEGVSVTCTKSSCLLDRNASSIR